MISIKEKKNICVFVVIVERSTYVDFNNYLSLVS